MYIYIYIEREREIYFKIYFYIYTYILKYIRIGPRNRVFASGLGDWGLIPGRIIQKTQKMVPDATLLNTQHYMVRIKGKMEQHREWSRALPSTSV